MLTLREGASFTAAALFDAEAAKENLEYLAAGTGQDSDMAPGLSGYDFVSDDEIELQLGAPNPPMMNDQVDGTIA